MKCSLRQRQLLMVLLAVYTALALLFMTTLPPDLNPLTLPDPVHWLNARDTASSPSSSPSPLPAVTRQTTSSRQFLHGSPATAAPVSSTAPTPVTEPTLPVLATRPLSTFCPVRVTPADKVSVHHYFRPSPQPVTRVVSSFLLQPPDSFCSGGLDILLLVPSSPARPHYRDAIRDTWGSGDWPFDRARIRRRVLFVLARPVGGQEVGVGVMEAVRAEAGRQGDVLVVDAEDGYRQMTVKMLAALLWVSRHCAHLRYLARVDEDHFLHLPLFFRRVHSWFQNASHGQPAILGKVLCSRTSVVHSAPASKHYVSASDYPLRYFPTYMGGGTYVMRADLVPRLVNLSQYVKTFSVDDAYITGVLARVLDVLLVNLPWVLMEEGAQFFLDHCGLSKHKSSPKVMYTIWTLLRKQALTCPGEPDVPLTTCAQWCSTKGYSWEA